MSEPIKILIADDEVEILDLMAKRVAKEGYLVIKAHDGQEAWEKIQAESPDVILLDLTMPRMDGIEVLKNLRGHPPAAKWQPVIIISALGELADVQKGLSLEADHYLTKPCQMDDVLRAIRTMVSLIPLRKPKTEIDRES